MPAIPVRDQMPYRDCAGIVVFNRNGEVFLGRRQNSDVAALDHVWQFPQGGIDEGEEPIDAALRELFEETSIHSITLLTAAPNWIHYDLPDDLLGIALKGRFRGQRQKWFAVLFEGDDSEIDVISPGGGAHPSEFSEWRWAPLDAVPGEIVPFKREAYEQIVAAFAHVPNQVRGL